MSCRTKGSLWEVLLVLDYFLKRKAISLCLTRSECIALSSKAFVDILRMLPIPLWKFWIFSSSKKWFWSLDVNQLPRNVKCVEQLWSREETARDCIKIIIVWDKMNSRVGMYSDRPLSVWFLTPSLHTKDYLAWNGVIQLSHLLLLKINPAENLSSCTGSEFVWAQMGFAKLRPANNNFTQIQSLF